MIISLRIPREFYADKFRLLEAKNVTNNRHGMVFIYENTNEQYANPRNYNQLGLCKLKKMVNLLLLYLCLVVKK